MNNSKRQRICTVGIGRLNAEERLEMLKLLARAGYTVRIGKERPEGKPSGAYNFFIEYWEE